VNLQYYTKPATATLNVSTEVPVAIQKQGKEPFCNASAPMGTLARAVNTFVLWLVNMAVFVVRHKIVTTKANPNLLVGVWDISRADCVKRRTKIATKDFDVTIMGHVERRKTITV
jgi:hypothetical protein